MNENLKSAAGLSLENECVSELKTLAAFERDYIQMVIGLCKGDIPKAAKILDISVSTIYRKRHDWEEIPH